VKSTDPITTGKNKLGERAVWGPSTDRRVVPQNGKTKRKKANVASLGVKLASTGGKGGNKGENVKHNLRQSRQ